MKPSKDYIRLLKGEISAKEYADKRKREIRKEIAPKRS